MNMNAQMVLTLRAGRWRLSIAALLTVAGLLFVMIVQASPAAAMTGPTEWPNNFRSCSTAHSPSGVYKLDFCASVGFHGSQPLGQLTLACRTVSTSTQVNCKSMTVNDAKFWGCASSSGMLFCTVHQEWHDSLSNVGRYVSFSNSFDCVHSPYISTYVTSTISARFPDNTIVTGVPDNLTRLETAGC
jgi:hypothetical protein